MNVTLANPITFLDACGRTVEVFNLQDGEGVPEHVHPYEHVLLLSAGEAAFTVGGMKFRDKAPAKINLPALVHHGFIAHGPATVVSVFIQQEEA